MDSNDIFPRKRSAAQDRTCWVCFATDEDEPDAEWTTPCRCCGATKWVHQWCLQAWIDQKQKGSCSVAVSCPQCKYSYQIIYPGTNPLLLVYEFGNGVLTRLSPMVMAALAASALYWVSFSYGIVAMIFAFGRDEMAELVSSPAVSYVVPLAPLIPWSVFGLKLIRPEVRLLKLWYSVVNPALQKIQLKAGRQIQACEPPYTPTSVSPFPFLSRCVMSALFVPPISALLGDTVFGFLKTTKLRRTLLGLSTYLLITLGVRVYLENYRAQHNALRTSDTAAFQ